MLYNYSSGLTFKISDGNEVITLTDVCVGDVWLCSGQSNIECNFNYCIDTEEYIKKFGSADIRFLNMEQDISFSENEELKNPEWIKLDENNYMELSTIGCIFGQILAENTDVPVGIIKNYRGGNSIISFLSQENMESCDEDGIFKRRFEREKQELKSVWSMIPSCFYNAMTKPLEKFFVKGMLWYQGETDSAYGRSIYYEELLKKLIRQYREKFNDVQLPIMLVQLCPFEMDPFDFKVVREIQRQVSDKDENIYLICTADMGSTGEEGESAIQPKNKTKVGERCAMAALANVYKKDIGEWSGPVLEKVSIEGEDLVIHFKHCAEGLVSEGKVSGFEIGYDDFFITGVEAEILDKNKVVIKNASDSKIVRYSYRNMAGDKTLGGNVKNSIGIPMIPFQTYID